MNSSSAERRALLKQSDALSIARMLQVGLVELNATRGELRTMARAANKTQNAGPKM